MTTIALLITSAIVAGCGYIVTESNADILLAGYNTMSKKEKEKFDLKGYLNFFKKFMLSVGLYSFIIYLLIFLDWNYLILRRVEKGQGTGRQFYSRWICLY